jgi:hypothetical protein
MAIKLNDKDADFNLTSRQQLLHHPHVINEMKLSRPSKTRNPKSVPATRPVIELKLCPSRQIEVHFRDEDLATTGKPAATTGVVLRWSLFNTKPAEPEQLVNMVLDVHSPFVTEFPEIYRGKTAWFCAAWQNSKGEHGAWSEFVSIVVP